MRDQAVSVRPQKEDDRHFSFKSPLRYPGGKSRGAEAITSYFPEGIKEILSPFFGGGSVELLMATKGVTVLGFDLFKPLVEFWECLLAKPLLLARAVEKWYPLSKEAFYQLQQEQVGLRTKIERAAAFYVINRSSFSGASLSGGTSPGHPRFTLSSIQRLRDFTNPNVVVEAAHFTQSLLRHKNVFAYLDPPYAIECVLYGKRGNTHKNFNHQELCHILRQRSSWVLSYNDCPLVRDLYRGYRTIIPSWKYGMSANKSSNEVLIFSSDLS